MIDLTVPVEAVSTVQPFDETAFHFLKCSPSEIICVWDPAISCGEVHEDRNFPLCFEDSKKDSHLVIVNVSPIERHHVLLVPFAGRFLPFFFVISLKAENIPKFCFSKLCNWQLGGPLKKTTFVVLTRCQDLQGVRAS